MIIANAFSLQMLGDIKCTTQLIIDPLTIEATKALLPYGGIDSCVGHADTAAVLSNLLDLEIPAFRKSVTLPAEGIIVAQVTGNRLPEGCTTLPEGTQIKFFRVMYRPAVPIAGLD